MELPLALQVVLMVDLEEAEHILDQEVEVQVILLLLVPHKGILVVLDKVQLRVMLVVEVVQLVAAEMLLEVQV